MSSETKNMIWVVVVLVIFMVGGFYLWNKSEGSATTPTAKKFELSQVIAPNSHRIGSGTAKVTVTEFGDYQCPACGAAFSVTQKIIAKYKNNPNFAFSFRNYPLPQHQFAISSAQFAEAAALQGKFWEMHDAIYAGQDKWSVVSDTSPIFMEYAKTLNLDIAKLTTDMKSDAVAKSISDDKASAEAISINSTPTFFVNGVQQPDWGEDTLTIAIDSALAQ